MQIRRAVAGAAIGAALVLGAVPAAQAQTSSPGASLAAARCASNWSDINTFSVTCSGAAGTKFYAVAECGNGSIVFGAKKYANGSSSYAYCAGKGGFTGYGWWVV
ncbi:hypothetical protein ACFVYP_37020 [Kitasatospora sp. NPDC058201]|uniref:hypothetical protein n=1 Tax=unclassified Kitasatospora TaxID=2633591 RepID=UPI00364BF34C